MCRRPARHKRKLFCKMHALSIAYTALLAAQLAPARSSAAYAFPFLAPDLKDASSSSNGSNSNSTSTSSGVNATGAGSSASSPSYYVAQEPNIHNASNGIFTLGSAASHSVDLPFALQIPSNGSLAFGKGTNADGGRQAYRQQARLQWWLSNANGSVQVPARFPSAVHLDLIEAGVIDDPNIGTNEGAVRWVNGDTWVYTADLSPLVADLQAYGGTQHVLYMQGLDTVANVSLAGAHVASTANQFREYAFNVTDAIAPLLGGGGSSGNSTGTSAGTNSSGAPDRNLTLTFSSAPAYAAAQSAQEAYYPTQLTSPSAPAIDDYEYPYRQFIRKDQSSFAWDWGPGLPGAGPYRPAWIVALGGEDAEAGSNSSSAAGSASASETDSAAVSSAAATVGKSRSVFVQGTSVDITRKGQVNNLPPDQSAPWVVNVTLSLWAARALPNATLALRLRGTPHGAAGLNLSAPVQAGWNDALSAALEVPANGTDAPELWWPASVGEPKLYDLDLDLEDASWSQKTGFRTVVLNQEPVSQEDVDSGAAPGNYWHFEINGKRIYTNGVNFIPADTFQPRISGDVLTHLLNSSLAAGQNLLRLWGGALYYPSELYDLADAKGLMLWSEAIFACAAAYPTFPAMLDEVREEIKQNVRTRNRHPSNSLWAGNNEGENMMLAVNETLANGTTYRDAYNLLFNDVILNAVRQNSRALSYIPSSTGNGYTQLDPYVPRYRNVTAGAMYGDKEHYDYNVLEAFDLDTYPVGREVNEFGMHSMPSIQTIDMVMPTAQDYAFNSTVMRVHDKHSPAGNLTYPFPADDGQYELTAGAALYYKVPGPNATAALGAREVLAQWAYATQQFQAAFIGEQILYYRLGAARAERNLGSAYWQLNSVWQGSDWASVQFGGRWKAMHYAAARRQQHVAAYPMYTPQNQTLTLYALSDDWGAVNGTARWDWYDYSGNALGGNSTSFRVDGINATALYSAAGVQNILPAGASEDNAWLHVTLNGTRSDGSAFAAEEFWPFNHTLARAPLADPRVEVAKRGADASVSADGERSQQAPLFDVTARGAGVAALLSLEQPEGVVGWFADAQSGVPLGNMFLRPNETRTLRFVVEYDRTNGSWADAVAPRSIYTPDPLVL